MSTVTDIAIAVLAFALGYVSATSSKTVSEPKTVVKYRFIPRTAAEYTSMDDGALKEFSQMFEKDEQSVRN